MKVEIRGHARPVPIHTYIVHVHMSYVHKCTHTDVSPLLLVSPNSNTIGAPTVNLSAFITGSVCEITGL